MTEQAPHIPEWLWERAYSEGSLACFAEFTTDERRRLYLRATSIKPKKTVIYVLAQFASYVLRDHLNQKTPTSRAAILEKLFLQSAPGLANTIASHGYGNATTEAANAIYSQVKADPDALAAVIAELKPLMNQPPKTS